MTTNTYNILSIIICAGGFGITFISLILVWLQLKQNLKTREVEVLLTLFSMSTDPSFRNNLDIIRALPNNGCLAEEQRKACGRACVFFELLGAIVRGKYMDTNLIEHTYGSLITSFYEKLRKFIEMRRNKEYGSMFAINFEFLAEKIRRSPRVSRAPGESDSSLIGIKSSS